MIYRNLVMAKERTDLFDVYVKTAFGNSYDIVFIPHLIVDS